MIILLKTISKLQFLKIFDENALPQITRYLLFWTVKLRVCRNTSSCLKVFYPKVQFYQVFKPMSFLATPAHVFVHFWQFITSKNNIFLPRLFEYLCDLLKVYVLYLTTCRCIWMPPKIKGKTNSKGNYLYIL